jgi:hypothetical protein
MWAKEQRAARFDQRRAKKRGVISRDFSVYPSLRV